MALQTLPSLAREYHAEQRQRIQDTVDEVTARYLLTGPRFDAGWSAVGPAIVAIVEAQQAQIVRAAENFTPAILEETGQRAALATIATAEPLSLVGYTGAGFTVADELAWTPVRAKQAVADGATARMALQASAEYLAMKTLTALADTARSAELLGMQTRNVSGYVRMVNGNACGRCVVQAGKWFRKNAGFLRHPRCRCVHIPASENVAGDWRTDPKAYFESLEPAAQIKLMGGKANAQAVIDGADPAQVINAYRKTSGMTFAQQSPIKKIRNRDGTIDKFTTEGSTRRGLAAQQQQGLRRNGQVQARVMPETISRIARDDADRIRLLKLYGWIRDDAAANRGRAAFTEARRIERNARAVERRAERAS